MCFLPAMSLSPPDVPAIQRLALDYHTLLDNHVGKGKRKHHLFCSLSGSETLIRRVSLEILLIKNVAN